jgi:DNA-binding HxlR family transcriptional regulator
MSATNRADTEPSGSKALTTVLDRIGNKWTIMVVEALAYGPKRFNAMARSIDGVSQRMLTLTLRHLERDGLVQRTVYPTTPQQVEYRLTDLGQTLIEPLRVLSGWAKIHLPLMRAANAEYDRMRPGGEPQATQGLDRG